MLSNVLYAIGVICIILALLAFLGVYTIASAGAGSLLVVGIVCCVVAYFLGARTGSRL